MSDIPGDWLWIVVVGFVIAFLLAFGIGANDVANSFGTSVGSKVLTLAKACILATIFEILGAVLIGYKVSDTIRKGIIDVTPYNNSEKLLLLGNLSALGGSCVWLFLATLLRLPVSATHSIVGATVGFTLVAKGTKGVGFGKLGLIAASWFISPLLSGLVSAGLFKLINKFVLTKEKPLRPALMLLPVFYGGTILVICLSVLLAGAELLYFDRIPLYGKIIISVGLASITVIVTRVIVVPRLESKLIDYDEKIPDGSSSSEDRELKHIDDVIGQGDISNNPKVTVSNAGLDSGLEIVCLEPPPYSKRDNPDLALKKHSLEDVPEKDQSEILIHQEQVDSDSRDKTRSSIEDKPVIKYLFTFLQILTAVFGAFAHGGNDVSNAIGPMVGLWVISNEQSVEQKSATPIWILLYGGVGISIGLCLLGRRVIKTMGSDLSKITPASGFLIEIGAALTVLVASNIGIPISTTHCKVGSIVMVGRMRSKDNVDWSLFKNIFLAWVITLPASGGISALLMYLLMFTL